MIRRLDHCTMCACHLFLSSISTPGTSRIASTTATLFSPGQCRGDRQRLRWHGLRPIRTGRRRPTSGGGRVETRRVWVTREVDWLRERGDWPYLRLAVCVEATRELPGTRPPASNAATTSPTWTTARTLPGWLGRRLLRRPGPQPLDDREPTAQVPGRRL